MTRKWYETQGIGYMPEPQPMGTPAPALAEATYQQVCSIAYDVTLAIDPALLGKRFYYPLLGALWEYLGTFTGPDGQYYMVVVVDTLPGYGIRHGSVWAAKAERFRRV